MNHILRLQEENKNLKEKLQILNKNMSLFLEFLNSSKFQGEENGERKDWINTSDVRTRIMELRQETLF